MIARILIASASLCTLCLAQSHQDVLLETVSPDQLRAYHDLVASETHRAGTPGDLAVVEALASAFEEMGLEVEKQELWLYLPHPVSGALSIVTPTSMDLAVKESPVEGDPYSDSEDHDIGWNAYSGTGDVTGQVVYVNHGRKQDYERLEELGVDLIGKIAIARYGGNFRGYKTKFAEEYGAIGLVIYTDPKDDGYRRGLSWPEGGYSNESSIQRGSILTLDYPGDPLTPFVAATEDAKRLDPDDVALPTIPVQPVGWGAAQEILSRMTGDEAPQDWQGALPFRYRVEGGEELTIRVAVEQHREMVKTYNVTGTLVGRESPEEVVVIGCHHDAWGYGAADPTAGLICVMESARVFSEAAKQGFVPRRSIVFAAWAAEEHGIIGSTEWVEAHKERLSEHGVAYLNLDMAAMGPNFGSSASPSLQRVMIEAAGVVPQCGDEATMVIERWGGESGIPRLGDLGGGSDHVGFLCHVGIPCASLGGGGSRGSSYHTLYDNLAWYRAVVGDDYEPARMVTRMTSAVALRLADEEVIPLDPSAYGPAVAGHIDRLREIAENSGGALADTEILTALRGEAVAPSPPPGPAVLRTTAQKNAALMKIERMWVLERGIPGRPWFRNLYAAPDADSGYAAWMLPALRYAVEHDDQRLLEQAEAYYVNVLKKQHTLISALGG